MSEAQISAYIDLKESGGLNNEVVWDALKRMPGQCGTIYEVIRFLELERGLPPREATKGNRFSAPIIRALSEGTQEGYLDDSDSKLNPDTHRQNTVYRWLDVPVAPRKPKMTLKEALQRIAELETFIDGICRTLNVNEEDLKKLVSSDT